MRRLVSFIPMMGIITFMVFSKIAPYDRRTLRIVTLVATIVTVSALFRLSRWNLASPIHKAMGSFMALAGLMVWLWPNGAGRVLMEYPASALYAVLLVMAAGPALLGREVFTMYFARRTTPEAVWGTDVFVTINKNMTWFWAGLFMFGLLSGLVPGLFGLRGGMYEMFFEGLLPASIMLGLGIPLNKYYPGYYQRKLGLEPARKEGAAGQNADKVSKIAQAGPLFGKTTSERKEKEEKQMSEKPVIVAVNGSPHVGIGNTSMMIEMLRQPLSQEGFDLEMIHLAEHEIEYCMGCGFCLERGKCWIEDDHRGIAEKLLRADGVILASPVYVMNVTGQMKTFLDRSLAFGHKPRPSWKPGLAISVSAGLGETEIGKYLSSSLRIFGAFSVGTLTAMATGPGEFMGKETVEARTQDLASDLARAIREKRRYPATDQDLRFYQFMSSLVKSYKDTVMKDDYKHWQEYGLFESFEAYIQQSKAEVPYNKEARDAWIKEMISRNKQKKRGQEIQMGREPSPQGPHMAKSCKELLQMMPQGFNPSAADGLAAVYQFEVSGPESVVAHLRIADNVCTYGDGPADNPDVVIKTPADVWLAISRGELDGQQAFMSGKYKVEGDLSLLLKLRALFSR